MRPSVRHAPVQRSLARRPNLASYRLAPWTQDDAIEYLLATDREACVSVMGRLKAPGRPRVPRRHPGALSVVLDRMARDESIGDVRTALRGELADRSKGPRSGRKRSRIMPGS